MMITDSQDDLKPEPAFLLYAGDFLADTAGLSLSAAGAYVKLLCHQWFQGSVPNDLRKLARLSNGWPEEMEEIWPEIRDKFREVDGGLVVPWLEEIRRERTEYRKRRSAAGKKGAESRWQSDSNRNGSGNAIASGNGDATALATGMRSGCDDDGLHLQSSSSPSSATPPPPSKKRKTVDRNGKSPPKRFKYCQAFGAWWLAYPKERRIDKQKTYASWASAGARLLEDHADWSSDQAVEYLQERIEAYARSPAAKRLKFVLHSHRWLDYGRYDDDDTAWKDLNDETRGSDNEQHERATF